MPKSEKFAAFAPLITNQGIIDHLPGPRDGLTLAKAFPVATIATDVVLVFLVQCLVQLILYYMFFM